MNDVQHSILQSINQKNEETEGYDIQAGLSWIYPTNYPLRDYQFNIIQKALYTNTLVTLPTGLGKTFIASVVMYNFYRWYPTGKIIFMAPTKPLVKQQIDACYDIMAIPKDVTAELTGTKQNSTRNDIWSEKRVFFITPQVLQNDLDSFADLGASIKCVVFDEAHKARGNYAYCEVMRKLRCHTKYFRVLALSATPGNSVDDVREVIKNLMISHLEFRTEESADVKPYVFQRKLETVVVPLGEKLEQVKEDYFEILEKYARTLIKYKIIQGNCSMLTKGRIFMAKKEFQEKGVRDPNYNEVMKTLNICITLYHALEVLIRHGLRGFLKFFEEHIGKPLFRGNTPLIRVVEDVREYLGPLPNVDPLPDGSYPEVPLTVKFGHPKFYKLRDILLAHFTTNEDNTRVIVFFEYRDSVMEAFIVLLQARPIIQAKVFLGQKSGITQRIQLNVIKSFREGNCNTLLSTSIGEEGLDVGEVDLIICFDISNKSPIRMVQRMGRTGRKREGQVIVLVTEGKEQQTLTDCLFYKNNMKHWAGSSTLLENSFVKSPRMVPESISPKCMKMHITVKNSTATKGSTLKDMFRTVSSTSSASSALEDVEIIEIEERIQDPIFLFNKPLSYIKDFDFKPNYGRYVENQRSLQGGTKIGSSDSSSLFVGLMKFADSKRFNIPLTQEIGKEWQNRNLKQGDIRSMFTKVSSKNENALSQDFVTQKSQPSTSANTHTQIIQTQCTNEPPISTDLYKELHLEIANYLTIELTTGKNCEFCDKLSQCNVPNIINDNKFLEDLKQWIPPDFSIVERITLEDMTAYEKTLNTERTVEENNLENSLLELIGGDVSNFFSDSTIEKKKVKETIMNFNAPKSFNNLLDTFNISSTYPNQENREIIQKSQLSDIEKLNDILSFFKLNRLEDIFESPNKDSKDSFESDTTIIYSRERLNLLENEFDSRQLSPVLRSQNLPQQKITESEEPGSPVLRSSKNPRKLKRRSGRTRQSLDIIDTSLEGNTDHFNIKFNPSQRKTEKCPNITSTSSVVERDKNRKESSENVESLDLGDLCDLSVFGLTSQVLSQKQTNTKGNSVKETLNSSNIPRDIKIDDLCDISMLFCAESTRIEETKNNSSILSQKLKKDDKINQNILKGQKITTQQKDKDYSNLEIEDFCFDRSEFELTQNLEAIIDSKADNIYQKESQKFRGDNETQKKSREETFASQNNHKNSFDREKEDFYFDHSDFDLTQKLKAINTKNNNMNQNKFTTPFELEDRETNFIDKSNSFELLDNVGMSTPKKYNSKKTQEKLNAVSKAKNDDSFETIVIEDSPVKGDVLDLTLSPVLSKKPAKRKLATQMSITQILSLAAKSTQATGMWTQTSQKSNLNSSIERKKVNSKDKSTRADSLKSSQKSNFDLSSENLKIVKDKSKVAQNLSILDDMNNFEEFDDSFGLNGESSSVFKVSVNKKLDFEKSGNKQQKLISKTKPAHFCTKVKSSKFGAESDDEFETSFNISNVSTPDTKRRILGLSSIKLSTKNNNNKLKNFANISKTNCPKSRPSDVNSTKVRLESHREIENISKAGMMKMNRSILENNSDDEFETTIPSGESPKKAVAPGSSKMANSEGFTKKSKGKRKHCEFIEEEADVSSDAISVSEDENSEDGSFDESFVDDETQYFGNDTQMHAKYLQSVRSPQIGPKFKIPANPKPITTDIFSQAVDPEEPNSYINDSFCVNTQNVDEGDGDESQLEILERKLKEIKRNKRKASQNSHKQSKRRRIKVLDSDSD